MSWTTTVAGNGESLEITKCKDEDAAKRIGHLCPDRSQFFRYAGGYPMSNLESWDEEFEYYACERSTNGTNSYCTRWSAHEDGKDEYERGTYTCDEEGETGTGVKYCLKWTSVQRETEKCKDGYVGQPSAEEPTYCQRTCYRRSRYTTTEYECGYIPHSEYEYSSATCTEVQDEGACLTWEQTEWDEHNEYFNEYETYKCSEVAASGRYCRVWQGDIDSQAEFEFANCEVDDDTDDDRDFPSSWTCYENGLKYWYPNGVWFLLPVLTTGPGILLMALLAKDKRWFQYLLALAGTITLNAGLCVAGVFLGGMIVLLIDLIYLGVLIMTALIALVVCLQRNQQHCRVAASEMVPSSAPDKRTAVPSAPPLQDLTASNQLPTHHTDTMVIPPSSTIVTSLPPTMTAPMQPNYVAPTTTTMMAPQPFMVPQPTMMAPQPTMMAPQPTMMAPQQPLMAPQPTTMMAPPTATASVIPTGEPVYVVGEPLGGGQPNVDPHLATKLRELYALYQDGILSHNEFEAQKAVILKGHR